MLQVTTENQTRADERLSILLDIPAKHKGFMAAPFIGEVDVEKYLSTGQFEEVLCGGENYDGARPCHYEWVKKLGDHPGVQIRTQPQGEGHSVQSDQSGAINV